MAKIIYSPHPLKPSLERKEIIKKEVTTVKNVIDEINPSTDIRVLVNGEYCNKDVVLKENDIVNIYSVVRGGGGGQQSGAGKVLTTVLQIGLVVGLTLLAPVVSPLALAGIALGGQLLIAGVRALTAIDNSEEADSTGKIESRQVPSFSLSSAQNRFRPYQPHPLVLSSLTPHRMTPDYAALPYKRNRLIESDTTRVGGLQ